MSICTQKRIVFLIFDLCYFWQPYYEEMFFPVFGFVHIYSTFFWNVIYSGTLLKDGTFFGLIPGLLWWVIKCFFHLVRLLCLWIDYLSSAAKFLNSVSRSVQCSLWQEELYHFFPLFLWPSSCSQIVERVLDIFVMWACFYLSPPVI